VDFGADMSGFDAATVSLYVIMGIHSSIEGLALGVLNKWSDVIAILFAIVDNVCLRAYDCAVFIPVPVGVVIGVGLRATWSHLAIGIIEALSARVCLFIGCHEWSGMFEHKQNGRLAKSWGISALS
jgi:zinc transporter 1/2/3